jgi:hypothetical protein
MVNESRSYMMYTFHQVTFKSATMNDLYDDDSQREGDGNVETTRQHPFEQLRLALLQGFCAPIGINNVTDSFVAMENDREIDEALQSRLVVVTAQPGVARLSRVAMGLELFLSALFLLVWTLYQLGESVQLSQKIDDKTIFSFTENC